LFPEGTIGMLKKRVKGTTLERYIV
jgi:hypothetical protein